MLGGDLDSRMNGLIAEANAELGRVAARHGVVVLPLKARLRAMLRGSLLRQPWDKISDANGLHLLTEHTHRNDRAASAVADLVQGALES